MRTTKSAVPGLAVFAVLIAGFSNVLVAAPEDLTAEFDADQFERLAISAGVGSIRVKAENIDRIQVAVELEPNHSWFSDDEEADLEDARIATAELASTLRLKLDLPRGFDKDDIEEHWDVRIPAHLETQLKIGVGEIEVRDTSGDVEAHTGVGAVDIDVVSGTVRAHASVGDARVRSKTRSAGDIDVDSDVGDAYVRVDGKRFETRRGWGPGASVRVDQNGEDRFEVTADVGNAELVIDGG